MFIFSLFWHFWILTSTDFLAFLELFYWLFCFLMIYIVYIYLVLPYSLEVWNKVSTFLKGTTIYCFTLLIGGLKHLYQIKLFLLLHLVLPYSLEVWNWSTHSKSSLSLLSFTLLIGGLKQLLHHFCLLQLLYRFTLLIRVRYKFNIL